MKTMKVLISRNIRGMVDKVNTFNQENPDNPIQRNDIVGLEKIEGQYLLVYFN